MKFGAHVSIRDHLHLAVDRAVKIGCECLQIFAGSPRQWREIAYSADEYDQFARKRSIAGLDPLVAHGAYLINLAASDPLIYQKSTASLIYAVRVMDRLRGLGAITHIGSRGERPWEEARNRIVAALTVALERTDHAMILLENSVGAGGYVGSSFDELRDILAALRWHRRIGICLDSAHLFAAGWDIRTRNGVDAVVEAFDRTVGLTRLKALHLNDSAVRLGARVDRHANIGEGYIGRAGFRAFVNHPALSHLAGFIETPGFDHEGPDKKNLDLLKKLRSRKPQA